MSKPLTPGTPAKVTSITVPEPGNAGDATELEAALQKLLDGIEYANDDIDNYLSASGGSWSVANTIVIDGTGSASGVLNITDASAFPGIEIEVANGGGGLRVDLGVNAYGIEIDGAALSQAGTPTSLLQITGASNSAGPGGKAFDVSGGASTSSTGGEGGVISGGAASASSTTGGRALSLYGGNANVTNGTGGEALYAVGGSGIASSGDGGVGGRFLGGQAGNGTPGYGILTIGGQGTAAGAAGIHTTGGVATLSGQPGPGITGIGGQSDGSGQSGSGGVFWAGSKNGSGVAAAAIYLGDSIAGGPGLQFQGHLSMPGASTALDNSLSWVTNRGLIATFKMNGGSQEWGFVAPIAYATGYATGGVVTFVESWNIDEGTSTITGGLLAIFFKASGMPSGIGTAYRVHVDCPEAQSLGGPVELTAKMLRVVNQTTSGVGIHLFDLAVDAAAPTPAQSKDFGFAITVWPQ